MLRSLFGDLYPLRDPRDARDPRERDEAENDFAATAILDGVDDEPMQGSHGQALHRHVRDLFVTGSPAQAMRAHFASSREDTDEDQRVVTLFDPTQMWASGVVKALADAGGQVIERLHLRDQASLNTLAMIERTTLPRRDDSTLKIYHADVHAQGSEALSIPMALLERSDLAVVIVGAMHANAVQELIELLSHATARETWRCPQLLFLCPVGAGWVLDKVQAAPWPASLHIEALSESLPSASVVWNLLLSHWKQEEPPTSPTPLAASATPAKSLISAMPAPAASSATPAPTLQPSALRPEPLPLPTPAAPFLQRASLVQAGNTAGVAANAAETDAIALETHPRLRVPVVDAQEQARALVVLQELMLLDGLIFAALVDAESGQVIASEGRGPDIDRAAVAAAEILRTHRRTLKQMGHWRPNDPVDEILVTAGSRYHILRTLQAHPDHFILAVLDKLRSNLAMTRFRIMEAQQVLG